MSVYIYYAFLVWGILWFWKKVKKKQPFHFFTILMVLILNLKLEPFRLSFEKEMGLLLFGSALFIVIDCFRKHKVPGSWRYAVFPGLYGLYLLFAS